MFQLMTDRREPLASTYVGKAEKCTYEFSTLPEQIPGESWLASRIIDKNAQEIENQGCRLLRTRIHRDTSPTWETVYRVEVWATASPIFWTPVIMGVLALFILVMSWKIIEEVKDIDWGSIPTSVKLSTPILAGLALVLGILLVRRYA